MVRSQKPISFLQIETAGLYEIGCADGTRVICFFALVIQLQYTAVGLWTQKIQANVDYCCIWRRVETRWVYFDRPRTQASEPALTDSSLAARRRDEALHVALFSTKHPSPARCCLLRTWYSRMMKKHVCADHADHTNPTWRTCVDQADHAYSTQTTLCVQSMCTIY